MTSDLIAELRRLESLATPGPWSTRKVEWRPDDSDCCDGIFAPDEATEDGPAEQEVVTTDSGVYGPDWDTAQFIVAARNTMARLLDEREALLDALREIANSDHAEDGGPECDHAYIADRAIAKVEAE